jgi:ABC-type nitrate/sulfonate/bicarbonate transport system substrate-binding protein
VVKVNIPGSRWLSNRRLNSIVSNLILVAAIAAGWQGLLNEASGLETVNLALTNRNFQMTLYPIAQERGYMQEEGIDVKLILVRSELTKYPGHDRW